MISDRRQTLIQSIQAAQELLRRRAREKFKKFVVYMKADYDMQSFHAYICDKLDEFEKGRIKKLMILLPPQHGKTTLATRLFSPYLLGKNPDRKIAIISYADAIATGFNRDIQRYIDNQEYHSLFPDTALTNSRMIETDMGGYSRTEHKFDIVGKLGTLKTVGRGGPLTSETVDIGIIDDLYKDRDEARSMTISEKAWGWYVDVFRTRLHNNSQQLLMNTRWDENDLAGRLLVDEAGQWEVIKFPAIRTADINDYDIRKEGEPLWPSRHSLEKTLGQKKLSEESFNSLYQQDPKPNEEVLIYKKWIEIPAWPDNLESVTYGLDFGKTTGTTALIRSSTTSIGIYFQELLYKKSASENDVKTVLDAYGYNGEIVFCDHEMTKINALRMLEVEAVKAIKGAGSVSFGIGKLNEVPVFYTADSFNLKAEVKKYQYYVIGKIITNVPDPTCTDHALDACRYSSVSRFFRGA